MQSTVNIEPRLFFYVKLYTYFQNCSNNNLYTLSKKKKKKLHA